MKLHQQRRSGFSSASRTSQNIEEGEDPDPDLVLNFWKRFHHFVIQGESHNVLNILAFIIFINRLAFAIN